MDWHEINGLGVQKMVYSLLRTGLDVSALRQEAISSNLSNINTPGYKASKVEFEAYLNGAKNSMGLKRTHVNHFDIDPTNRIVTQQKDTEVKDNGNNVDIDYEMSELSANNIYYDAMVSQLNAKYSLVRSAMK